MKILFWVTVFFIGSFFIGGKILAANTDIVINEIGVNGSKTHEWVEIWNKGTEYIDIKNWRFWTTSNHILYPVTSTDSIMAPNEYAVISEDSDVFLKDFPNFVGSLFDSSWSDLNDNGAEIGLRYDPNNFVEHFTYVSTTKNSLERSNPFLNDYSSVNWQENSTGNTAGAQNSNYFDLITNTGSDTSTVISTSTDVINTSTNFSTTTTTTSTDDNAQNTVTYNSASSAFDWSFIKLNEIVSDPEAGNEEVELFNTGSSTVDLNGGSICDATGNDCKILAGVIMSHDWLVADLSSDRYLNNDGDSVFLKDSYNNIVDSVVYGTDNLVAPDKGQSLIRRIDGVDTDSDIDWAITTKITTDTVNELFAPVKIVHNNSGGSGGGYYNQVTNETASSSSKISTSSKSIKVVTKNTPSAPKDTVNISWKLDWPYGLDVNELGIFSAKGTADPRGGEVYFVWNFGDNTSATGHLSGHSYATSGIYLVSVIASSSAGTLGKKEFKIYVGKSFSVSQAQIKISNWLINNVDDTPEYIEINNNLSQPQNISGWKIKNKSGKEYELPDNTILVASGTLKFYKTVHHLIFEKDGDEIRLTTPNNQIVDSVKLLAEKKPKKEVKITSTGSSTGNKEAWLAMKGTVTVEPKIFGQQFFYISDGENNAQVYQYKKDFPDLKIGDYIAVRGVESLYNGVKRIKIKSKNDIDILSTDKTIEPTEIKLGDFSEEALGSLIKVEGDITEIKSNLFYLDDGISEAVIYLKKGAKIDKKELKEGDKITVVGILDKAKDGWRIMPRSLDDIKVLGYADEVLNKKIEGDKNIQSETTKKYLEVTAGGIGSLLLGFMARARGMMLVGGAKKIAGVVGNLIKRG